MTDLETQLATVLRTQAQAVTVRPDVRAVERAVGVGGGVSVPRSRDAAGPRRRRWHAGALIAGTAAAVIVLALVLVAPGGGGSRAWAGWTRTPQAMSPADVSALEAACRRSVVVEQEPDPGNVLAVDIRGVGGFAVFDSGSTCSGRRDDGGTAFTVETGSYSWETNAYEEALAALGPAHPVVWAGSAESEEPASSYAWGVRDVNVQRITLHTPTGEVEAQVVGQIWLAWWPETTGFDIELTATDSSGQEIVRDSPEDLWVPHAESPGEQACAAGTEDCPSMRVAELMTDAAASIDEGTRRALADGFITDAEFADWRAQVETCMTDQGFEISFAEAPEIGMDYPVRGQPGPIEPALAACEAAGQHILELRLLQDAYPDYWAGG